MKYLRSIRTFVVAAINTASEAKDTQYRTGYLNAMGDVLEEIDDLAWEEGEDLSD